MSNSAVFALMFTLACQRYLKLELYAFESQSSSSWQSAASALPHNLFLHSRSGSEKYIELINGSDVLLATDASGLSSPSQSRRGSGVMINTPTGQSE